MSRHPMCVRAGTLRSLALAGTLFAASCNSSPLPTECEGEGVNPFTSAPCAKAIDAECSGLEDAASCAEAERLGFGDLGGFRCAWTRFVKLEQGASCSVASVEERCVGAYISDQGCQDACNDNPNDGYMLVDADAHALVEMACRGAAELTGPLSATAICSEDVEPPHPLCACVPQACEAL